MFLTVITLAAALKAPPDSSLGSKDAVVVVGMRDDGKHLLEKATVNATGPLNASVIEEYEDEEDEEDSEDDEDGDMEADEEGESAIEEDEDDDDEDDDDSALMEGAAEDELAAVSDDDEEDDLDDDLEDDEEAAEDREGAEEVGESVENENLANETSQLVTQPVLARAWYINLNASIDRRDVMEEAYRRTGIQYQRFSALAPSAEDLFSNDGYAWLTNWLQRCSSPKGAPPSQKPPKALCALAHKASLSQQAGLFIDAETKQDAKTDAKNVLNVIGCTASKVAVLQLIQKVGKPGEVYLIAEDDFEPIPDLAARLPPLLATVPTGWDVLKLDPKSENHFGLRKAHGCGGSHALLVPFEKAGKLYDLYTGKIPPVRPSLAADCMLGRNMSPHMNNYNAKWGLFHPVKSLVHNSTIPGHKR